MGACMTYRNTARAHLPLARRRQRTHLVTRARDCLDQWYTFGDGRWRYIITLGYVAQTPWGDVCWDGDVDAHDLNDDKDREWNCFVYEAVPDAPTELGDILLYDTSEYVDGTPYQTSVSNTSDTSGIGHYAQFSLTWIGSRGRVPPRISGMY